MEQIIRLIRSLPLGTQIEYTLGKVSTPECLSDAEVKLSIFAGTYGGSEVRSMVVLMVCLDQDEDEYVKHIYSIYVIDGHVETHGELKEELIEGILEVFQQSPSSPSREHYNSLNHACSDEANSKVDCDR